MRSLLLERSVFLSSYLPHFWLIAYAIIVAIPVCHPNYLSRFCTDIWSLVVALLEPLFLDVMEICFHPILLILSFFFKEPGASPSWLVYNNLVGISRLKLCSSGRFCHFPEQVMWAFSIYLEAVAIFPQLVLLQRTRNIDNLTGQYVFFLG